MSFYLIERQTIYQRPYAWDEDNCQTLWDDIFSFAIPDNDATKFDTSD